MKNNTKIYRCIPPSPNWFSFNIASLSPETKLFAYAASTTIFLLNSETLQYVGHLSGHSSKINALDTAGTLCASGSSDKTVRCWDMENQQQVASLTSFKVFLNYLESIKIISYFRLRLFLIYIILERYKCCCMDYR